MIGTITPQIKEWRERLARMEQDVSLAGNSYTWAPPGEDRLVRLRPDWVTIVSERVRVDNGTDRPG